MVYNKTKRGLEKAAGIIGTVVSGIEILTLVILFIACAIASYYSSPIIGLGGIYSLALLLPLAFTVVNLIISAKCIKSPVQEDGMIANRNGLRICFAIFSFIDGQWITLGLMIAVLCMKDLVEPKPFGQRVATSVGGFAGNVAGSAKKAYVGQVGMTSANTPAEKTLDEKVAELKYYKELGVIDDEAYKKAVDKIIKEIK